MSGGSRISSIVFYLFIIIFILLAYLYNNGVLSHMFQRKASTPKVNAVKIGYKQKEFQTDYSKKFQGFALELAGFEGSEKWKGDYILNDSAYLEGSTSYTIYSKNNQATVISLQKKMDLSDFNIFKMLVYIDKNENINSVKKFILRLGNMEDNSYFEYDIRNLVPGWNLIQIEKSSFTRSQNGNENKSEDNDVLWRNIEKISIVLDSLPKSQSELSLDRLWAEKNETYKNDFRTANDGEIMISVKSFNDQTYVNFWELGSKLSLIDEITDVQNFTYTAKLIPQKKGSFGINGRTDIGTGDGYFLDMGGAGLGSWQLYKHGEMTDNSRIIQLDNGVISNYQVEINKPVWLRLVCANEKIAAYFSNDGINFIKLTDKSDDEIKSGGIGVQTTTSSFLLESVTFKQ